MSDTITIYVDFKDPDVLYRDGPGGEAFFSAKARRKADCGEYFAMSLEVDKDLNIISGKFVTP